MQTFAQTQITKSPDANDPATHTSTEKQLNILIVEDSFLIACGIQRLLEKLGHKVIGPVATSHAALELITKQPVDAAILDVSLGEDTTSEPVAQYLRNKGLPFIFITGHSSVNIIPTEFAKNQKLLKPVSEIELKNAINKLA